MGNAADGVQVSGGVDVPTGLVIGGTDDPTPGGACDGDCNLISANGANGFNFALTTELLSLSAPLRNFVGSDDDGPATSEYQGGDEALRQRRRRARARQRCLRQRRRRNQSRPRHGGRPAKLDHRSHRIGTDVAGDAALANDGRGIYIASTVSANDGAMTGNVIGGSTDPTPGGVCDGDCNVIGGNGVDGITLFHDSFGGPITATQIVGNHIGADAAGTAAVANSGQGITFGGLTGSVIGSTAAPNLISGNAYNGVRIQANPDGGNVIQGNRIGTTANGAGALAKSGGEIQGAATPAGRRWAAPPAAPATRSPRAQVLAWRWSAPARQRRASRLSATRSTPTAASAST